VKEQYLSALESFNYFCQTDIHIAEPIVSEPRFFEEEKTVIMLKGHKSPNVD